MTSLPEQPGRSLPIRLTRTILGILRRMGRPAIAVAPSIPPPPMASIPIAPPVVVWLSVPRLVLPGIPKRAYCTLCMMPLPGRDSQMPYFRAMEVRKMWSSGVLVLT